MSNDEFDESACRVKVDRAAGRLVSIRHKGTCHLGSKLTTASTRNHMITKYGGVSSSSASCTVPKSSLLRDKHGQVMYFHHLSSLRGHPLVTTWSNRSMFRLADGQVEICDLKMSSCVSC